MEGVKRKRRCEIECKEHIFAVQSLKGNSSKYDIKLQFCPKYQREPLPPEHTYPEYNDDEKFYTSAFILGVDRRVLVKNEQQELMDHQKQIRDSLEKHNQLVFPRPNSKHSLCSVCKEHYKNYYFHIASEQHRDKIGLSLYNNHINDLCSRYQHLWLGAEERADAEAELRSQQEEQRRLQMTERNMNEEEEDEEEEDEDELLDVQRGSREVQEEEEDDQEEEQANYPAKPIKKHSKSVFRDEDTIPFTAKTSKRAAPEGRTYTSDYLRKKFQFNAANQERAHREREERRYERERDKLKTERDNPERSKEFIKKTEKDGDIFVIMKAAFAIQQPQQTLFVWKRTTDRFRIKETPLEKPVGALENFEKENKKYQIDCENKFATKPIEDREAEALRHYYHYYYPPFPSYFPDHQSTNPTNPAQDHRNNGDHKEIQRNRPENHKNPAYNHNPYVYPPSMYGPHFRAEKHYNYSEKDEKDQKSFEYPPMPYGWPYPPYYMPPPLQPAEQPITTTTSKQSTNNSASNSASVNFPMYMCPPLQPPYASGRYPPPVLPPYANYQPPYPPSQPSRENYVQKSPNGSQHTAYPPYHHPAYQFPHHGAPLMVSQK